MAKKSDNVLTEGFLAELYNAAITDNYICSVVCNHMKDEFLPDQQYQQLTAALKRYFLEYKMAPQYGVLEQMLSQTRAVS